MFKKANNINVQPTEAKINQNLNATKLNHTSILDISDEDDYSNDYKFVFGNLSASATFGLNSEVDKKYEKNYEGGTSEEIKKQEL